MSVISDILGKLSKTHAQDWTFRKLEAGEIEGAQASSPLEADGHYVSIVVERLWITDVRAGFDELYGVVHGHCSLTREGDARSDMTVIVAPPNLAGVTKAKANRILLRHQPIVRAAPYRGGTVDLEAALVAVRGEDLAGPYVNLLQSLTSIPGASFLSAATSFIEPVRTGVRLLFGQQDATEVQIGVSTTFRPETGCWILARAPQAQLGRGKIRLVGEDLRLVDGQGKVLEEFPYMVIRVEALARNDDWASVPELQAAYKPFREALTKGDRSGADEALASFRRVALTSADLLLADAKRLVAKLREKRDEVFADEGLVKESALEIPPLEEIELYEEGADYDPSGGVEREAANLGEATRESPVEEMTLESRASALEIDIARVRKFLNDLKAAGVEYGLGKKLPSIHAVPGKDFTQVDCSGFVRAAIRLSTQPMIPFPDGSVVQHDWVRPKYKKVDKSAGLLKDGVVRIAFLRPQDAPSGVGHVVLIHNGVTYESHSGVGPDSRPWNLGGWQAKANVYDLSSPKAG